MLVLMLLASFTVAAANGDEDEEEEEEKGGEAGESGDGEGSEREAGEGGATGLANTVFMLTVAAIIGVVAYTLIQTFWLKRRSKNV